MAAQPTESGVQGRFRRAAALLGVAGLCAVLGGAAAFNLPAEVRKNRQERLDKMNAEQRAAVKVQFERFKALPESEKNRWRQFHAELKADSTGLKEELDEYILWLGTLSLPDREKIRGIPDPVQRAVAVQELRKQQARKEQFGQLKLPRFGEEHLLSKADFEAATLAIHRHLQQNPPNWGNGFSRMDGKNDPLSRAARMLPLLGHHLARDKDPIAQQAIDVAQEALSDRAIRTELDKTEDPKVRRYRMYVLLIRTWGASIAALMPDPNTEEGQSTLESHFHSLDAPEKEFLYNVQPDSFWNWLRASYARKNNIPLPSFGMMGVIRDARWKGRWPMQIHWMDGRPGFGRRGPGREGDRGRGRGNENPPPPPPGGPRENER